MYVFLSASINLNSGSVLSSVRAILAVSGPFPALSMFPGKHYGKPDYICIKAENLISLMKAKKMLKGRDEDETGMGDSQQTVFRS